MVLVVKILPANARDIRDTVWSLGQEDTLVEGMATYCSILAWKIPRTEEHWWPTVHGVAKSWTQLKWQHAQMHPGIYILMLWVFLWSCMDVRVGLWRRLSTKESKIEKDTCTPMFIAALFTLARTWKQPRRPLTEVVVHIYNGILLSHKSEHI